MEPIAISHFCAYLRTRNYSPHTIENRSYWIPGSYAPTWSENRHAF